MSFPKLRMDFPPKRIREFAEGCLRNNVPRAGFPRAVPALYHVPLSRSGHLSLISNQSSGLSRGDCHERHRERQHGNRINSRRDGKSNFRDCISTTRERVRGILIRPRVVACFPTTPCAAVLITPDCLLN